jgi:hypothetical protein
MKKIKIMILAILLIVPSVFTVHTVSAATQIDNSLFAVFNKFYNLYKTKSYESSEKRFKELKKDLTELEKSELELNKYMIKILKEMEALSKSELKGIDKKMNETQSQEEKKTLHYERELLLERDKVKRLEFILKHERHLTELKDKKEKLTNEGNSLSKQNKDTDKLLSEIYSLLENSKKININK